MTTPTTLRRLARAAPCALLMLLAACSNQELYSQLSERQANEMVALLRSKGIDADKQSQEGHFSVTTSRGDFAEAMRLLNAQGYPRETFDSMGKVFKREGFVSSPLEERARLMHAMSQEISNTLASIDGVVTARVHLVVPERNPLVDKPQPAAAAVMIKHRRDTDLSAQVPQIKALVVNSIEGLAYENVTVALFPAEDGTRPGKADAPDDQRAGMSGPLLSGGLVGALALGGGGVMWLRRRKPAVVALIGLSRK
ncbi:MAG TPA: type III secretion inner membrane ring lipoprotein SctJ [Albitalea sp.]|nr:type III secretion inner membrane ring lipoprotein SctJ [Albitalea sp.]